MQVDFDATNPGRSGVVPDGIGEIADAIATAPGLMLGGLMTVAPLGEDPAPHFAHLVTALGPSCGRSTLRPRSSRPG